jgi:hypothetical protein
VGAIRPRNCLALNTAGGAFQCVIWNIDIENFLFTFDAISNVRIHATIPQAYGATPNIVSQKLKQSKGQGSSTK